jgi:hypothetical protein
MALLRDKERGVRRSSFMCPITLALEGPVEPGERTAVLLRRVFGERLAYLEQGWLVYLAEGSQSPPAWFGDEPCQPGGSWFRYMGPADRVLLGSEVTSGSVEVLGEDRQVEARVRLVVDNEWRTVRNVLRQVRVESDPSAARYVSLVVDRFDKRGWRVERIGASRCRAEPVELPGREGQSVEFTPFDGLWWWGAPSGLAGAGGTVSGLDVDEFYERPAGLEGGGGEVG